MVASAPGKVLMTGGYLVLERPNAGLVLSTNARFYAIVKPIYPQTKPDSWAWVCSSLFFSMFIISILMILLIYVIQFAFFSFRLGQMSD